MNNKEMPRQKEAKNYFEGNEWRLPTDIGIVNPAADKFRERLLVLKWKEEDVDWLETTFREALINAIVHGNLGLEGKSEDEDWREAVLREQTINKTEKSVYVRLDITSDKITLTVRDEGKGFDWKKQLDSASENTAKTSGRGETYMKAFFDSVSYNEAGNEVTLIKERNRVVELFIELGVDVKQIHPNILRKLRLLNERTKTFQDEQRSIHLARALFRFYQERLPLKAFSEIEQKTVLVGTAFTDIGKTGPRDATPEQEEIILDIYSVEHAVDPLKINLSEFVGQYFPEDAERRLSAIEIIDKVDRNMTMRAFYNLHPWWTLEIVSGDGVPPEAIAAAAAHHALEGVNPEEIIGKDGRFAKYFGDNLFFDRAEKLIILLDKYDAFRRRGKEGHKEAIDSVRKKIKSNPDFTEDVEFEELLDNLDAMVSADEKVYEI